MISRRTLIQGLGVLTLLPLKLTAAEKRTLAKVFKGQEIQQGRVNVTTPALAENGNSVPLGIEVDSPMSAEDYVTEITVFADANPVPELARYQFTAASGLAKVSTRVRFANSQRVVAVARMSDGSLWRGGSETIITLAACVEPLL